MSQFVAAKSDQTNAEDLLGGPRTITIAKVWGNESAEQPVSIGYRGDNGKPWKPCKTARRILMRVWGPDATQYVGRSLTIYRDPAVKFGGLQVGGIRISHMSHIDAPVEMALLASQKKMQAFKVQPLRAPKPNPTTGGAPEEAPARSAPEDAGEPVAPVSGFDMGEAPDILLAAEIEAKLKLAVNVDALGKAWVALSDDIKRLRSMNERTYEGIVRFKDARKASMQSDEAVA